MPAGGRADPGSAGGTDGESARGHRSGAAGPRGRGAGHLGGRRRDAPARACQPASPPRRFPLLSRPPPPAAAPRAPPAKLSLFSPLSPPCAPLPPSAAGGRDRDFLRSRGWGRGPPAAAGPGLGGGGSDCVPWPGGGDHHLGGKGATEGEARGGGVTSRPRVELLIPFFSHGLRASCPASFVPTSWLTLVPTAWLHLAPTARVLLGPVTWFTLRPCCLPAFVPPACFPQVPVTWLYGIALPFFLRSRCQVFAPLPGFHGALSGSL